MAKPLPKEVKDEIYRRYIAGEPFDVIARECGCHVHSIPYIMLQYVEPAPAPTPSWLRKQAQVMARKAAKAAKVA